MNKFPTLDPLKELSHATSKHFQTTHSPKALLSFLEAKTQIREGEGRNKNGRTDVDITIPRSSSVALGVMDSLELGNAETEEA